MREAALLEIDSETTETASTAASTVGSSTLTHVTTISSLDSQGIRLSADVIRQLEEAVVQDFTTGSIISDQPSNKDFSKDLMIAQWLLNVNNHFAKNN